MTRPKREQGPVVEGSSKMQAILDAAQEDFRNGQGQKSFDGLVEAIKLLSRAQAQIMGDLDGLRRDTNFKVG